MAWIEVCLTNETFKSDDDAGVASARRVYLCRSDTPVTSEAALSASAGGVAVPAGAASFSSSRPLCKVNDRDVKHISPRLKEVTVRYSDPTDGTPAIGLLSKPAKITRSSAGIMEEYVRDSSPERKFVRNTAGVPFERGPDRRRQYLIYNIQKFVTLATANQILQSLQTTNDGAKVIKGFSHAAETLLLADVNSEQVTDTIESVTLQIEYEPRKFIDATPNWSHYIAKSVPPGSNMVPWERIRDANNQPIEFPWPLDQAGATMPNALDDPYVSEFQPYPKSAWPGVPLA